MNDFCSVVSDAYCASGNSPGYQRTATAETIWAALKNFNSLTSKYRTEFLLNIGGAA